MSHVAPDPGPSRGAPPACRGAPLLALVAGAALAALPMPLLAEAAPAKASSEDRPFLWEIAREDAQSTYLLGSIHLADASIYPLPDAVEAAYAEADVVAVEADVTAAAGVRAQQAMAQRAAADAPLAEVLPEAIHQAAAERLAGLGMDIRLVEGMQPWFVALMLTSLAAQQAGLSPEHGVEYHFIRRARDDGKAVVEVEGLEAQLAVFDGLDPELQVLFLKSALVEASEMEAQFQQLLDAWRRADAEALVKLRTAGLEEHPELAPLDRRLYDERNAAMAERVAGYVEEDRSHLVILGAAHLVGDGNVVALLEAKGLEVARR